MMSNVKHLRGTKVFIKPKLLWKERLKEKSVLELRYNLAKKGLNKELLRIGNLKLHYHGTALDESKSFEEILCELKQSSSTFWLPHKFYCCLLNARCLLSLEKRSTLLDYLNLNGIDIFFRKTWLDSTYDNRTLSLYGQFGAFSRTGRQNGKHGGVIFLLRRSPTAKLIEIPLIDKFDFASDVVLFLQNNVSLQILLAYVRPKNSSYIVSCDVLRRCIIEFLDESKKIIPGYYKRSLYVMGDLNLPNATWALMCSPNDYENQILTTLSSFDLFHLNFSTTHKAGNILDNMLYQHPFFSDVSVDINCHICDHYPLMFTLNDNTETPISNPLSSRYSFTSHDELVKFEQSWASCTSVDYAPSTGTVDHFYDHLLSSIQAYLKWKPRRGCNFLSTTHGIQFIHWTWKTLYNESVVNPLSRESFESSKNSFSKLCWVRQNYIFCRPSYR